MDLRSQPANLKNLQTNTCKCEIHIQVLGASDQPERAAEIHHLKHKRVRKAIVEALRKGGLLGEESNTVCDMCVGHAEELIRQSSAAPEVDLPSDPPSAPASADEPAEHSVHGDDASARSDADKALIIATIVKLCDMLKTKSESASSDDVQKHLLDLTEVIATQFSRLNIAGDMKTIENDYKDVERLKSINSLEFIRARDPYLVRFFQSAVGVKLSPNTTRQVLFNFAVAIEAVYHLRNLNLILPHCFRVNLIETFISGSKTVTALNGKVLPAAS